MITLAAIVRNEAHVITRMLDSVAEYVDRIVIVDTGSTDGTIEAIREWQETYFGKAFVFVDEHDWVDFGTNRSQLIEHAKCIADDKGWILLADADFTFEFGVDAAGVGSLLSPGIDCYQLSVTEGETTYRYRALISADLSWQYEGQTHEVLDCTDRVVANLDAISIIHHHDGGCRTEKFERDLKILLAAPKNHRNTFYLAQTYACLGMSHLAVRTYWERARMGGWDEEVYYSMYRAGVIAQDVPTLLQAWNHRPHRLEALYVACTLLRDAPWAVISLVSGATDFDLIEDAPDDTLFVEPWVYEYGLIFELTLALHNAGKHKAAREGYVDLLTVDTIPDNYRASIEDNLRKLDDAVHS